MVVTELVLIAIGIIVFIASFFVTERLSQKDLEQISRMSETELNVITEKQLRRAKNQLENSMEDIIEESLEQTKRGLEKETNEKIMAVSEYSDTVIEEINNIHNEIVFLYSMLKEKQTDAANMVSDLQRTAKQIREMDLENVVVSAAMLSEKEAEPITVVEEPKEVKSTKKQKGKQKTKQQQKEKQKAEQPLGQNEQILLLYKEGKDEVEIAKTLNCGLGVVRLVLGLYHET